MHFQVKASSEDPFVFALAQCQVKVPLLPEVIAFLVIIEPFRLIKVDMVVQLLDQPFVVVNSD